MAWKREGDTAAFDPRVLSVVEHEDADERSVNEVWGFFSRMTSQLAQYPTDDNCVTFPQALQLAGSSRAQVERLWAQCQFAGLGRVIARADGRRVFQVLSDADFVHVKSASELAFERQRKRDNGRPDLTVLVRHRDGDACRYCQSVVWFGQKTGDKRGTYDHRPPGLPATADTLVVACGACNSGRGALSRGLPPDEGLTVADRAYPLMPAPQEPYWTPSTRTWLNLHHRILSSAGLTPPAPPADGDEPLPAGSPAPGAAAAPLRGDAQRATGPRPAAERGSRQESSSVRAGQRPRGQEPARAKPPALDEPGRDGAGRAGSGRDGSGRAGQGRAAPDELVAAQVARTLGIPLDVVEEQEPEKRRRRTHRGGRGRGGSK